MEKKTPTPEIPVIRANGHDVDLIFALYAASQELERAEREIERRFRAIPGGWRDLRLIRTKLANLLPLLKKTVQPEKRRSMDRMAPRMRFRVWCGHEAVRTAPDEVVLAKSELATLMHYSHQECSMCVEQRCGQCRLGKVYDSILLHDRNGGSWAAVDFVKE